MIATSVQRPPAHAIAHRSRRGDGHAQRRCRRASTCVVTAAAFTTKGWVRYGVRDDIPGGFTETYGLDLGAGGGIARETFKVTTASSALVPVIVTRPMGMTLEEEKRADTTAITLCVVVDVAAGSNADAAGVKVGDILRGTSAVLKGKSKVKTEKWAVEPSLDQRVQMPNVRAAFVADAQPFERIMGALVSNGDEVNGVVAESCALLFERGAPAQK